MKYKEFLKWFYICILILETQSIISIPTGVKEIAILAFLVLSTFENDWKVRIKKNTIYNFVWILWIVPEVVIWLYSITVQLIGGYSSDYLVHTCTLFIRRVLYVLLVIAGVKIYGRKIMDIVLTACVIAYVPAWIRFLSSYGIGGILLLFDEAVFSENIALEVHGLTYIFGFLSIYYFYRWCILKTGNSLKFLVCLLLTFCGLKRIAIVALAVALIIILVLGRIRDGFKLKLVWCGSIAMIAAALLYVYFIHSGMMEDLMQKWGIDTSFRIQFWNYFRNRYSITPAFWGYGISYSHIVMTHVWQGIDGLGALTDIHNDVLGFYLGLGFIGSLLYWSIFFYWRLRFVRKHVSPSCMVFIFVISVYYFILMMVTNIGIYAFYNSIYFMLIYVAVCELTKDQIADKNIVPKAERRI